MRESKPSLQKTKWGFYQYSPIPSEAELKEYYSQKYYQLGLGSYAQNYDEEELKWWRVKAELVARMVKKLRCNQGGSILGVGCGEGWLLSAFHSRGYMVSGFDFTIASGCDSGENLSVF